ncbi:MAG TPA: hypothetical protein VFC90_13000 [Planctomycetota bacterium]|nr:hypothetical protein [Planctomycetota bacterium]
MKCTTCGREAADLTCPRCEPPPLTDNPTFGVTRSKVRYRPLSHTRHVVGWKLIAVSIVGAIAFGLGLYSLASKRATHSMEARGFLNRTETIEPGHSFDYDMTRLITGLFDFEVEAHDGPVIMAIGSCHSSDGPEISPDDLQAIYDKGVRVEAGSKHRMEGTLGRGRSLCTVINPNKDKAVRVTIRFNAM